jgi:hypothetical protein
MWIASVAMVLTCTGCVRAAIRGSQPETRSVVHHEREIDIDLAVDDAVPLLDELARRGMPALAVWTVPGELALRVAFIERPPADTAYGPQLVAIRVDGDLRVLHESGRLYDVDFAAPTFFTFSDRTLLLADHGSEDAYGVLAWSIENGDVRDLGQLPIALPEDQDVFTRGAAPWARVEIKEGKYVITIPGPLLLDPRGEEERLIAKNGEVVTFKESAGRFEIVSKSLVKESPK